MVAMIMKHASSQQRIGPHAFAHSLAWLRICAISGQTATVLVCALWLELNIPLLPLLVGIGVLAVFAVCTVWRLMWPWPIQSWEPIVYVAFDTLVLGYLLYCTGGAGNPFITLLLVPVALSATALPLSAVFVVAALVGVAYIVLLFFHLPLPISPAAPLGLPLHELGMALDFVIATLLLGFFIHRLTRELRLQQLKVQRVRERTLRDEGILAIATQAAGAAHELNTPLSTMRTLLPEIRREHAEDTLLSEDLAVLESQVDRCRTILRELVAFGQAQLSQEPEQTMLADFIHDCLERFQLLRPEVDLQLTLNEDTADLPLRTPPGLRHALINLLNNAADASALNQSHVVALAVGRLEEWLEFIITDHGPGFAPDSTLATLGQSLKQTGLGLGLALAEATAERLDGELTVSNTDSGARMTLRLPLAVIARA